PLPSLRTIGNPVQDDLNCSVATTLPAMMDFQDGDFARQHPKFKFNEYLKIELNADDLNITNSISHRVHKVFLIYWSLLNLRREHRSTQISKRIIAACDWKALKHGLPAGILHDFFCSITKLAKDGIKIMINGVEKHYYVSPLYTLGDYPAQQAMHGRKESVSAARFCPGCDVLSNTYVNTIDQLPNNYTIADYNQACGETEAATQNGYEVSWH
ncbi:unnamed protein product, partial [Didymodactylos carnosus]